MAEFFLAQTSKTVALNCNTEDPGAACIIQPLSTVMNAMDRLGDLKGKSLAVMGLGSIGLLFCWLAKRGGRAPLSASILSWGAAVLRKLWAQRGRSAAAVSKQFK